MISYKTRILLIVATALVAVTKHREVESNQLLTNTTQLYHGKTNQRTEWTNSQLNTIPNDILSNNIITNEQDINKVEWWKKSSYYHIYVRSFRDSNNDGNGDLRGIIEKLDYLKMLGVRTILMSPIYESPMRDGGYDITNHTAINPLFGTMQDFDDLLAALKQRKMHVVMDFIPNHVSSDHHWFACSERAFLEPERCGKFKDYFIWNNSTRNLGKYPTNWISVFGGGPAWHKSKLRNEFYLAQFLPEQPDLNMSNPLVREELKNIVRFWLSKGVDGLRVDAMPFLLEDVEFWRDEPNNDNWQKGKDDAYHRLDHKYTHCYNGTAEIVREWYQIAKLEFEGNRAIINEANTEDEFLLRAYGTSAIHRFSDAHLGISMFEIKKESMNPDSIIKNTMVRYNSTRSLHWPNVQGAINPWLIWTLGNHDFMRRVEHVGENNLDFYVWIGFFMPGSVNVYYGDEIGTHRVHPDDVPGNWRSSGNSFRFMDRALMAWSPNEPSAGFSNRSDNWNSLTRNYKTYNVKTQLESTDKHNHLKNFIAIQKLRNTHIETFIFGETIIYTNAFHRMHQQPNQPSWSPTSSMIYTIARVHDKFGSLLLAVNLNNSSCEILDLVVHGNKPHPPDNAEVELINYERSEEQDKQCGSSSANRLIEGSRVNLNQLPLGPSQAAIFRYQSTK